MSLGERLDVAIKAAGLSQAEVARRVPCKVQQVNQIVKNQRKLSKYLVRIAEVIGVNIAWLTTGQGPWKPDGDAPMRPIPADTAQQILAELKEIREKIDALVKAQGQPAEHDGITDRVLATLPGK